MDEEPRNELKRGTPVSSTERNTAAGLPEMLSAALITTLVSRTTRLEVAATALLVEKALKHRLSQPGGRSLRLNLTHGVQKSITRRAADPRVILNGE